MDQSHVKENNNTNGDNNVILTIEDKERAIRNEALQSLLDKRPSELFPTTVQDSTGEEIRITYSNNCTYDNQQQRETWGGKIEFLCTCVAMAVGLGNVWRFPYLCYKNGGGAFLIPYFVMLVLVGLPIFFMELAFGQFASLGPITVWSISPLFKGVGYGMVLTSFILSTYYNIIISQCLYYFIASLSALNPWSHCSAGQVDCVANFNMLPWTMCDRNIVSNRSCIDVTNNITTRSLINNLSNYSPTEQYYENKVLKLSESIFDIGIPQWKLVLCLVFAWIIVILVLLKGVNSLGKVAYFTAIFPYIILTILLIRGCMLPGAWNGIKFYLKPTFARLKDPKVWTDAATQIFFSLSCCNGNLITMSSYNNFKNNCCRDAVFVAILNCATSIFAGFVIFSNLGFMAGIKNTTVDNVVAGGPGLAFVVYPEALSQMMGAPIWSILFFLMMITLGFGSQLAIVETVLAGIQDELRRHKIISEKWHISVFRIGMCCVCFIIGIPMTCRGGMYILTLLDYVISGYVLLFLALFEIVVICYVYGINRFSEDIALMTTNRPNWYWKFMWLYITPSVIIFLIIFYFVAGDTLSYGSYIFPDVFLRLSHLIAMIPLIWIPAVFLYRYCKEGGWILLSEVIKPKQYWGPANQENRQEFISSVMRMDELNSTVNNSQNSKLMMLHSPSDNISVGEPFFQSKRSLASKFSEAAAKELNKTNSVLFKET